MLNVTLYGYVGVDAELKTTEKDNKQYITFTVAHNTPTGTVWVRVRSFNIIIKDWVKKGRKVCVVGRMEVGVYNDRPSITVIGDHVELDAKDKNGEEEFGDPEGNQ